MQTKSIHIRVSDDEYEIILKKSKSIKRKFRLDKSKVLRKVLLEKLDDEKFLRSLNLIIEE